MDSTPMTTGRGGRFRTPDKPTAEEKRQASEVSLGRIARLFTPYRWPVLGVVAIIVAASIVGLASPFLLRGIIDTARPQQDLRLLVVLTAAMVVVAAVTSVLGVVQTWVSTKVGQRVMHGLRTDVFAHLQRQSVGFFTRTRTGEVQARITNDIGGMQSVVTSTATSIASNLTTTVATAVAMIALSWRLPLIPLGVPPPPTWPRPPARDLAQPPRRPDAPGDHSAPAARARRPERHHRRGPLDQRRPAQQDDGHRPDPGTTLHRVQRPADRPRAALAARRPVADGVDERDL